MADDNDRWVREHTDATQEYVLQAVVAGQAKVADAIIAAVNNAIEHTDKVVADLRREMAHEACERINIDIKRGEQTRALGKLLGDRVSELAAVDVELAQMLKGMIEAIRSRLSTLEQAAATIDKAATIPTTKGPDDDDD